jgi:putative transposase
MRYDAKIHHRRSIRLADYHYANPGAYFVTICTHHGICLFGAIQGTEMSSNDAGRMISRWWAELASKYAHVRPDMHVVMPNHFHGIIIIEDDPSSDPPVADASVGAALRGRPPTSRPLEPRFPYEHAAHEGAHEAAPLSDIIGWLKTMTTNEYIRGVKTRGWPRFVGHLWQRDYFERVIRSENELLKVREYVLNNPAKWEDDPNHPSRLVASNPR